MTLSLKPNRNFSTIARWLTIVLILLPTLASIRQVRTLFSATMDTSAPSRGGTPREEEVHTHAASPAAIVRRSLKAKPRFIPLCLTLQPQDKSLEASQSALWLRARNSIPIPTDPTVATPVLRGPPCA